MRKLKLKLTTILLCAVLVLSLGLPAAAAQGDGINTLKLHYTPGGTAVEGVAFHLYRVAAPDGAGGYALADGYEGAELQALVDNLNAPLLGSVDATSASPNNYNAVYGPDLAYVPYNYSTARAWVIAFGGYINNNTNSAPGSGDAAPYAALTTDAAGDVSFGKLEDGIYLVASNTAYEGYVAAPFILQLPYVDAGGDANNYVAANVKWFTPRTPPATPEPLEEIPEDEVPLDDGLDIIDDEVPLGELPDLEDEETLIDIIDEAVPEGTLPQTGLLWWPVPVLAAAGVILVLVGLVQRKRGKDVP